MGAINECSVCVEMAFSSSFDHFHCFECCNMLHIMDSVVELSNELFPWLLDLSQVIQYLWNTVYLGVLGSIK